MTNSKRFAVVLSGCGHKDGTEITEAISVILALSENLCRYEFFAPDMEFQVKDPVTASPMDEKRNVLMESSRITRGQIKSLDLLNAKEFEGLILPGGFGAATILCNFGIFGSQGKAIPLAEKSIREFYEMEKPILAVCIAPALVALVLGKNGITVTAGPDKEAEGEIQKTGARVEPCPVNDFITDRENKIISTPAYMYGAATPFEVYSGIRGAVRELVEMS